MNEVKITVYGADWCPDCRRSKQFLTDRSIPFTWVDTDQDKDAEALVRQMNHGMRIIPTIIFEDGTFLAEPSNNILAEKLNLQA